MLKKQRTHNILDIDFRIIYSGRRTLGISVLPDSMVIVRVPYLTSFKTISRVVKQKAGWIIENRDKIKNKEKSILNGSYIAGEAHLFRGNEYALIIEKSGRNNIRFYDGIIEMGLTRTGDPQAVKRLLYKGYRNEASVVFPEIFKEVLKKYDTQMFKPAGLVIRTMKRRWGGCSNNGIITLSTELIKLPDKYIEYVILHELCHLKHHNHSARYYKLLSELCPEWRSARKELTGYIQSYNSYS